MGESMTMFWLFLPVGVFVLLVIGVGLFGETGKE